MLKRYTAWTSGSHWLNPLFFYLRAIWRSRYCNHSCMSLSARLRNDLYCVEWDVKLYYTIPYLSFCLSVCLQDSSRTGRWMLNKLGGWGQTSGKVKFWCRSLSGYGSVWISIFISDPEQHENDHLLVYCGETTGQMSFIPAEGG